MIPEADVRKLVNEIARGVTFYGISDDEKSSRKRAVAEALQEVARDMPHAERIAAKLRAQYREFPTVADVYTMAQAVGREDANEQQGPLGAKDCPDCGETGFAWAKPIYRGNISYNQVRPCGCRAMKGAA